jgi:RNA polymerase sigma-70 factor (sigma-E family)
MGSSQASFEDFVRAHTRELLRTACLITWDDAEAEDLVQECLLRVSSRWRRVRAMDMPLAYARRVLINLALGDRDKRSRRRVELRGPDHDDVAASGIADERADPDAEAALHALGEWAELLEALGQLAAQQRAVLVLRYVDDLSEAQVADLLGCSTGTVKSRTSRGLAHLRELMAPANSTPEVCEP